MIKQEFCAGRGCHLLLVNQKGRDHLFLCRMYSKFFLGFGTGSSSWTTAANVDTSGLTGMRPFGRAQNCSLNITYDSIMARGGNLVFPTDQKFYNGNIEGSLEYAAISRANLAKIYGGTWTSGGAGSGT